MKYITRPVLILSLVSLLTDTASEMLYPVLPIYLKSIGFSVVMIGILEGIAEATAGLSKGYFGRLSDVTGQRAVFVQAGYALSAVSKPMMAFFVIPVWIFFARTLDRLGKGLRTGARDAILSDEADHKHKGKVFGFHRSMDTLGAVIGPLAALIYLYYFPEDYISLFFIAFIPGLLAVSASLLIKDKNAGQAISPRRVSFSASFKYWKDSPKNYRNLVTGLLFFALFNSSDVFLLLKAKQSGLSDSLVIGIYIFYNLVYAVFALPMGVLADKLGLKRVFITGLMLFAAVYFGMSFDVGVYGFFGLFFLYGVYAAATEGISKAWIAQISDSKDMGTAIGTYAGLQSICLLIASSFAGWVWYQFGPDALFVMAGLTTVGVIFYMAGVPYPLVGNNKN